MLNSSVLLVQEHDIAYSFTYFLNVHLLCVIYSR